MIADRCEAMQLVKELFACYTFVVKIYTKRGDGGKTSLLGGERVDKSSIRIAAYGTIDELNSLLGVVVSGYSSSDSEKSNKESSHFVRTITKVQEELMVVGSNLAAPRSVKTKIPKVTKAFIARLEKEIDRMERQLPKLKNFILPGGGKVGAKLHLARSVCRRAERLTVMLDREEKLDPNLLIYINRLADWFFVAARYANKMEGAKEQVWKGRSKT